MNQRDAGAAGESTGQQSGGGGGGFNSDSRGLIEALIGKWGIMNTKRAVAVCVIMCLAGMTACTKTDSAAPATKSEITPTVQLDLATPDKAIKSYWAVRDSVRINLHARGSDVDAIFRAAEVQLGAVTEGALLKRLSNVPDPQPPETFGRDIIDVKVESESRAVIVALIKNTTPVPAGAEVSKFEEQYRRDGERYKYVLEKSQAGWRVVEIWSWETYPKADWKKMHPGDGKPTVAALAYNGV
ncbi:MAG: hypothetical protein NT159_07530 [Proteobacteria bacterium]|nr:hypothetical protein [Pseudomonadota bacterium]